MSNNVACHLWDICSDSTTSPPHANGTHKKQTTGEHKSVAEAEGTAHKMNTHISKNTTKLVFMFYFGENFLSSSSFSAFLILLSGD